jgi:hypothetical protein
MVFSPSWLYGGLRHLNRNVDYGTFWFRPEEADGDVPYVRGDDGQHVVRVLSYSEEAADLLKRIDASDDLQNEELRDEVSRLLKNIEGT